MSNNPEDHISCDICGKPVHISDIYIGTEEETICKTCYDEQKGKTVNCNLK